MSQEPSSLQVWCLDNDDMAIDVSRHLLDSLEEEDITAHERRLRLVAGRAVGPNDLIFHGFSNLI